MYLWCCLIDLYKYLSIKCYITDLDIIRLLMIRNFKKEYFF